MGLTKINKIEMKGFKSFANKTEILFGETFNCVLGPNGSGKSNILDALCFVLGKASAKGLRAEKSANLIYNGGKLKNPAKDGTVAITFDNSNGVFQVDSEEVKISRIIKPTGASVYKINDKTHTRQQVLDLLSQVKVNPDGHNIILQGDIVHLIEMSPVERRGIVEEIAGISIYETKKDKALRELTRVEEKINEADIILTERKTYLKELKSERDQAQKFKDLDDKIKRNKATLLNNRMKKHEKRIDSIQKDADRLKEKIEKAEKNIDETQAKIKERKEKIDEINKEVEEKGEKEQIQIHKEIEEIKVKLGIDTQRTHTLKDELVKLGDRKKELDKTYKELQYKINQIDKQKDDTQKRIKRREDEVNVIKSKIDTFKKKHKMEDAHDIDKKMDDIDKEADKLQDEIGKLREEQQFLLREKDKNEISLETIDEKINKVLNISKENKKAIEGLKQKKKEFKKATTELSKALNDSASFASQLENARNTLLSRKEEQSKLNLKSTSIKENIAGGLAIQQILALGKKQKGIYGTISDLGQVSSQHSLALEIAAGQRIKSIVVENDSIAAKCIQYLKDKRYGVATFLPLNKIKAPEINPQLKKMTGKGIHGLAVDLISFDKKFEKVFRYVFGNTLVIDHIETARRLGIGKARMVTVQGDLVEVSGAMQGGYRSQKRAGMGFQEKEVHKDLEKIEKQIADLTQTVQNLEIKQRDNQALIDRLRELKANLEADIIKTEKSLHLDSADLDANKEEKAKMQKELKEIDSKLDKLTNQVSEKNQELARLKIDKQQMRDKINELRNPRLIAELNTFEQKKSELEAEIIEIKGDLRHHDSELSNILLPEKENIIKILKQHEKESGTFEIELKEIQLGIKNMKKDLSQKEESEKKFYAQFKELFNKRNKLNEEINKFDSTVNRLMDETRDSEHKISNVNMDLAKFKAEYAGMEEEYKQFEGVELFQNKKEEDIKLEIREFERMVQNIGAVNMKALEIYDRAENEYQSLQQKKDKLTGEREDVLLMINEIDSKKRELFMKSFDVLSDNFKKIFSSLSSKGEAALTLEDPKDPFNGGLEIKVRLSGRKFLDIRSLSGGEKTMTALAFIFAIQEHEPASFYVLDEVDAALDKRNSEKLSDLIKTYANRAQYIMISHNDGIISNADSLFGISMNEHGISKITSLKI